MSRENGGESRKTVLDPVDRLTEIMFGLLMALTFTGTMSVTVGAGGSINSVLLAALGCNVAWGMIDGIMYLLATATERARAHSVILDLKRAPPPLAREMVRDALPGNAGESLADRDADTLVDLVRKVELPAKPALLTGNDVRAAFAIMVLVILATIPPILPFVVFADLPVAMRFSNLTAVVMLVAIGIALDRVMKNDRWLMRLVVPVIGVAMVAVTILLGG